AKTHRAQNDKTPAEREDHQRRQIRTKDNNWNEACKKSQDAQADVSRLRIGDDEFLILRLLRVHETDQRRTQYAFIDDFVKPVDGFLRFFKQLSYFSKHDCKRHTDNRQ